MFIIKWFKITAKIWLVLKKNFLVCNCETKPLERAGPRHSLSFWALILERDETSNGQIAGTKNTGKRKNPRLVPFGAKKGFTTFAWISWISTDRETRSTQALASWTLVTPPATTAGRRRRRLPWATPLPLRRLGLWLRSLGPADSLMTSPGFCRPGSERSTPRGGRWARSCAR